MNDRQTIAQDVELIVDPDERAALEAENALLHFDAVLDLIDEAVRDGRPFRMRASTVLTLHRIAMDRVHSQAGTFRNAPVTIAGSRHQPPPEHLVAIRVEDMCDWINEHWRDRSALELCSDVMWRLNWIHPFADGNGRTTRAIAYLVLCVRAGARLPGSPTIPEQIAEDKPPYYNALEAADRSEDVDNPDLSAMQSLLQDYLTRQLDGAFAAATRAGLIDAPRGRLH